MILESFHKAGTNPEYTNLLNINVTGYASSLANTSNIRGGILSVPMALWSVILQACYKRREDELLGVETQTVRMLGGLKYRVAEYHLLHSQSTHLGTLPDPLLIASDRHPQL